MIQDIVSAANKVWNEMRSSTLVPNPNTRGKTSTGNLAFNALKITVNEEIIDIEVDQNIAPYMPFTNEEWLSQKWNGMKNPNEGWWERFADEFAARLATELKGELK